MILRSSGNVGIGTTTPVSTLNVAGTFTITAAGMQMDNGQGISAKNAAGTYRQLVVLDGSNNLVLGGTVDAGILFMTSGGNERMRIDASGNVGIGTNSPTSKLQVGTGAAASTVQAQFLGGVTVFENTGATASVPTITFNNDLDTGINNPSGNTLALYTGGSERMRIDSGGSVGIGDVVRGGGQDVAHDG
jgi:hypothetical protein